MTGQAAARPMKSAAKRQAGGERTFEKEVQLLRLGEGEIFEGEGILAVTKAALQAGVSYVGGYQGSPVSHLVDVLSEANDILDEYGVHLEIAANEAGAAAMLGASVNYPIRGLVTWKSIVGTNVAADALSSLASTGVMGGAMVVIGEDYGEGASIIQERSHAFALKSHLWLLDPRPNLTSIVNMVEKGFEMSEATNTPVILELRILACHVQGRFTCKDNATPRYSRNNPIPEPKFKLERMALPPFTYAQERDKVERRMPAAIQFIKDHKLNEMFPGDIDEMGIILQGGLYNTVMRSLGRLGLADDIGNSRIPIYVLNVTHPLVDDEIVEFCAAKSHVLVIEEGSPAYLEGSINIALRKADVNTKVSGKDVLPATGQYTNDVVFAGVAEYLRKARPRGVDLGHISREVGDVIAMKQRAAELLGEAIPARPPGFCTGCPERPVFTAIKLMERELGPTHISADIGCHTFAALPPFNLGNTVMGYGSGLASSTGIAPNFGKRTISIMGDGGFWHGGLTSGVASASFNQNDSVLIVMKNGYTSATGWQFLPSSPKGGDMSNTRMSIEKTIKALGIRWQKKVYTYDLPKMVKTLREAMTTTRAGLKVIIAEAECQLARQRRVRAERAKRLAAGKRAVRPRFGIDEDVCTGDHSCIRLSGCPSLTIKPNPDPLRTDPVAHIQQDCVGCGLCGEVAHAAVLCPSFFRAEIVYNPSLRERILSRTRRLVIGRFYSREALRLADPAPGVLESEESRAAA